MSIQEDIPPPRQKTMQRIAISGVASKTALAGHLLGNGWLRLKAKGATVQFYMHPNNVPTIVFDELADQNAMGYSLMDGASEDFYCNASDAFVIAIGSGAGFLEIMRAGRERSGKPNTG
mgnify:CR=1 FL=1